MKVTAPEAEPSTAGAVGGRTPTPEQAAAIAASGHNILLEAGAGTGKTGVMVDRYCRLTCEQGVSPDAILAFTFTDKAAAELRQRIRAELVRRAEEGSQRARELLAEIGAAWVTTIHGFCNRLLVRHPVAVGIDPRFRVLDAPETARAAREAFEDALEEFLEGDEGPRETTVAAFTIEGLRDVVVAAHAELRSRGFAQPRLPEPPSPDVEAAIARVIEVAGATLGELKPDNPRRELLETAAADLAAGSGRPSLEQLDALRLASTAKVMAPYCEALDAALARCAEAGEGGAAYRHLADLLTLFSARFEAAKARRAGIDFEDLQILAVGMLEQTEVGKAYRDRFAHLMVDEFQDTNRLQLRLIEALRGPDCELMVVGDEFQSIYGFRHADLDVFREQRERMRSERSSKVMELSGNFRSQPAVIGAVNALAGKLLGESYRPLRAGAPATAEKAETAVELLLTARDGWDEEGIDLDPPTDSGTPLNCLAEARFLAARLRALVDAGAERSEMVVLLRAFTHLEAYEDSLERVGLRPYVLGGRGYWSQQQVADVCALLATIANPLDDQSLFGALASPACGLAPDTLWLLRAAAGEKRHVWPALERASEIGEPEIAAPERLLQIPESELALLRRFVAALGGLRERGTRLSLAGLIEEAVSRTGYDLAVLMRPGGEARFANVRKLMRIAAEFEAREGRDLRGLLDFLASRAEADAESEAATAVEGHDGVRIMTIHNAKGLEFGVVAVPDLSRSLLAGSVAPVLTLGRGAEPRVGMQLRRLGARSINLYSHAELCEERKQLDSEEELRLFYVAATRARDHLLLSGVVKPDSNGETKASTPVVERIVNAFEVDRDSDSTIQIPAAQARGGLELTLEPSQIAVQVNLPSPARARELAEKRQDSDASRVLGDGPAPLVEHRPPAVPRRPLSYTAISAYAECPYRFYSERVLGLGSGRQTGGEAATATPSAREERAAYGSAVHALLEWSHANGWRPPDEELARRYARAAGVGDDVAPATLIEPVRGWLESSLFREQVAGRDDATRAEAPLLLGIAGTVLRGSIDLLVERPGSPPLVIDYKTDRLASASPEEHVSHYAVQRSIYALAVSEFRKAPEVEVAYVFLERPDEPALSRFGPDDTRAARESLAAAIEQIAAGEFPPAVPAERSWALCQGCPALGRTCSGPHEEDESTSESAA